MTIDTKLITQLRAQTGVGVLDCRQSLEEADGNIDKAIEILRKRGATKAAKKAERVTKEGVVMIKISPDNKKGSLVAINCETDFVAKNETFLNFVKELTEKKLAGIDVAKEFADHQKDLVLKIGENVNFGKADLVAGAYVAGYLHTNKKVASLIVFNSEVPEELARDLAMHIVATNPLYLKPADIPSDKLTAEKEIYEQQIPADKPAEIKEKIITGKLAKYYEEVCLYNQLFVKDDTITIEQLINQAVEQTGRDIEVEKFISYQVG